MKHARTNPRSAPLTLRRESLRDLSAPALRELGGGAIQTGIPTRCECTGFYPSLNAPCTLSADNACIG